MENSTIAPAAMSTAASIKSAVSVVSMLPTRGQVAMRCAKPSIQCYNGRMPWTKIPPPTRNMAGVPATDGPIIIHGADLRMPAPIRRWICVTVSTPLR